MNQGCCRTGSRRKCMAGHLKWAPMMRAQVMFAIAVRRRCTRRRSRSAKTLKHWSFWASASPSSTCSSATASYFSCCSSSATISFPSSSQSPTDKNTAPTTIQANTWPHILQNFPLPPQGPIIYCLPNTVISARVNRLREKNMRRTPIFTFLVNAKASS